MIIIILVSLCTIIPSPDPAQPSEAISGDRAGDSLRLNVIRTYRKKKNVLSIRILHSNKQNTFL